jgi:ABC-type bacteriocin/lantibiotic exporter with double-glycine peptidase domain
MLGLKRAVEAHGLRASAWRLAPQDLRKVPLPAVAFVEGDHFVVVESVTLDGRVNVLDPARGRLRYPPEAFNQHWLGQTLVFGEIPDLTGSVPGQ